MVAAKQPEGVPVKTTFPDKALNEKTTNL